MIPRKTHSNNDRIAEMGSGQPVTMCLHTVRQVSGWLKGFGFTPLRSLAFRVYMDLLCTNDCHETSIDSDFGLQNAEYFDSNWQFRTGILVLSVSNVDFHAVIIYKYQYILINGT